MGTLLDFDRITQVDIVISYLVVGPNQLVQISFICQWLVCVIHTICNCTWCEGEYFVVHIVGLSWDKQEESQSKARIESHIPKSLNK